MLAVPVKTVHVPVPIVGRFPLNCVVVTLHKFCSAPALDILEGDATLTVMSSVDDVQLPLDIVHLNTALLPILRLLIAVE